MNKTSFYSLFLSFISLMTFWVIMSGFFDFIHLSLGVVSVITVIFINHKMKKHRFYSDDMHEISELRIGRIFYYVGWMIVQVILAGFHVFGLLVRPSIPYNTSILTFRADLPNSQAKMILGNSITLTPGTLTVDIDGDLFTIHCLDDASHEGITSDQMPREVLKLFQKEERQVIRDVKITRTSEAIDI